MLMRNRCTFVMLLTLLGLLLFLSCPAFAADYGAKIYVGSERLLAESESGRAGKGVAESLFRAASELAGRTARAKDSDFTAVMSRFSIPPPIQCHR